MYAMPVSLAGVDPDGFALGQVLGCLSFNMDQGNAARDVEALSLGVGVPVGVCLSGKRDGVGGQARADSRVGAARIVASTVPVKCSGVRLIVDSTCAGAWLRRGSQRRTLQDLAGHEPGHSRPALWPRPSRPTDGRQFRVGTRRRLSPR